MQLQVGKNKTLNCFKSLHVEEKTFSNYYFSKYNIHEQLIFNQQNCALKTSALSASVYAVPLYKQSSVIFSYVNNCAMDIQVTYQMKTTKKLCTENQCIFFV